MYPLNGTMHFSFTPADIPMPFTVQALYSGVHSILNPPNLGQSIFTRYVGKPVRALIRLIYAIAIGVLIAPLGVLYHTLATIRYAIEWCVADEVMRLKIAAYAMEHFKSIGTDLLGTSLIFPLYFCIKPPTPLLLLTSRTLVAIPSKNGKKYGPANYMYRLDQLMWASIYCREGLNKSYNLDDFRITHHIWTAVSGGSPHMKPQQIDPNGLRFARIVNHRIYFDLPVRPPLQQAQQN